ncbi:MAG: cobalamin-dependent protein [Acidobacteria bacterium]|nr:cobalamin-dependent protein [Acidobacteriota bacterium]
MNANNQLCVKLIHCGNRNIACPQDQGEKNIFIMPMGLFALADALKKNTDGTIDIEIIHMDIESGKPIEEILDFETLDVVGFDCHWVNQSLTVMQTAELIKQHKPGVFILLGGYSAGLFAEEIMGDYQQIDAIIRGDAEIPIVELCKALYEQKKYAASSALPTLSVPSSPLSLANVQNLVWRDARDARDANQKVCFNNFTYIAKAADMEKLDFAALELLRHWEHYRAACPYFSHFEPFRTVPVFYLEVGRGCGYACTYCGGNCVAQKKISNREKTEFRSIDSVIKTIRKALSFGYQTFYTCMENEESDAWYIRLFQRLKSENIRINFCYSSWRLPSQGLIDAISSSCEAVLLEISAESADDEVRKKNKDPRLFYTTQQFEECFRYISQKTNIKVQLYFGYYLAFDTRETIFSTIRFAIDLLHKYSWFLEIGYDNLSTDPGSLFFFAPEKYELHYKPRTFKDYLASLQEMYQGEQGNKRQLADMTLFRPKNITAEEDSFIRGVLMALAHSLNSFKKSLSYILEKTGDSAVIMEFLENVKIPADADSNERAQITRDYLMEISRSKNILDFYLQKLIYFEYEKQKTIPQGTKVSSIITMDYEKEKSISSGT